MEVKDLHKQIAEQIMGWQLRKRNDGHTFKDGKYDGEAYSYVWATNGDYDYQYMPVSQWKPDEDRNQSRRVVARTLELLHGNSKCRALGGAVAHLNTWFALRRDQKGAWPWLYATAYDECQACLWAINSLKEAASEAVNTQPATLDEALARIRVLTEALEGCVEDMEYESLDTVACSNAHRVLNGEI